MIEVNVLSHPALVMLANGYGYRCDDQSELGACNAKPVEILDNEINELGNRDINDFISEHYGWDYNSTPVEIDCLIKKMLNAKGYHLIWLCDSKENDLHYVDDDPSNIYKVDLPENSQDYMLVSDIDTDGCLFAVKDR